MKRNSFVLLLLISFVTGSVHARHREPTIQEPDWISQESDWETEIPDWKPHKPVRVAQKPNQFDWPLVGALSTGPVLARGGLRQTFYLASEIEKTYVANQSTNILFDGEVFLGLQKTLSKTLKGQLGLAVAATNNTKLSGVIWDDADPRFDNFTYDYALQHTHVAIKGKLLVNAGYWLIPWVSTSLGIGFNNAHSFNNTPTIFEALPNANFSPHTTIAFTYTAGVGVQKALNTHWQVGAGYEFADWGNSTLGRAAEQTLGSGLALNHLYTNGVLLNLTYIA